MPFVASIDLGVVGDDITSVKLYACTNNECNSCTELTGYTEVLVSNFPMNVDNIPEGTISIKAESIGRCNVSQCIPIVGIPTAIPTNTPTPLPTETPTPTPTSTSTPIPPTETPTPTSTPTPEPTSTPTPTPTSTPTSTPEPTIECLIYTVSTTSGTGQSYTYIACDGTSSGGNIGGAGGYDADTFCAQVNTVELIGSELSLSSGESCTEDPTGNVLEASAGGYMQPCIGGTIDDYMGAGIYLTDTVTVETVFDVTVYYKQIGNTCSYPNITTGAYTQNFQVTVLAGEFSGDIDPCLRGAYFPSGANICGACVTGSDNTIDTITFNNPGGC